MYSKQLERDAERQTKWPPNEQTRKRGGTRLEQSQWSAGKSGGQRGKEKRRIHRKKRKIVSGSVTSDGQKKRENEKNKTGSRGGIITYEAQSRGKRRGGENPLKARETCLVARPIGEDKSELDYQGRGGVRVVKQNQGGGALAVKAEKRTIAGKIYRKKKSTPGSEQGLKPKQKGARAESRW